MMIQGSVIPGMTPPNQAQPATKLTSEQVKNIADHLSSKGASDLTDDTVKDFIDQNRKLVVISGSDLAAALEDAGIDVKDLAEKLGGANGTGGPGRHRNGDNQPPPPPPPPQVAKGIASVDETIVTLVADAVAAFHETGEEDATSWAAVSSALEEAGYDTSQSLVDFYS